MFGAVDLLASQYGWTMDYILYTVTPEQYDDLKPKIRIRQIDDYLTLARIAIHPSTPAASQREFINAFQSERRQLQGMDALDTEIDKAGIARLKQKLSKSPRIAVK